MGKKLPLGIRMLPLLRFLITVFVSLASFRVEFQRNIFLASGQNRFATIDIHTFNSLQCLMENVDATLLLRATIRSKGETKPYIILTHAYSEFLRATLWQGARHLDKALTQVKKFVSIFSSNQSLAANSGPHFMSPFHICFQIAIQNNDFVLAKDVNVMQQELAKSLHAYKAQANQDLQCLPTSL